jgi:hypothetical protein
MKLPRFVQISAFIAAAPLLVLAVTGAVATLHAVAVWGGVLPKAHPLPPAYPAWTVIHFGSALAFVLLAPWQFLARLRGRHPSVHRIMGRVAVAAAAVMGLSGVVMAYLPDRPVMERLFMTTFFLAFLVMLFRAFASALARDIETHRAWMIRLTATALTPMTQRLVFGVLAGAIGIDGPGRFWEIFVSAAWLAWLLNLAAAEWWIHRRLRGLTTRPRPRSVAA